jgi:two-component system CheB/CheR fusion protein
MTPGTDVSENTRALVVTGSSAGGIEALTAVVSSLKRDFPAPIVVAQHLDPKLQSRLGEILASRSQLPVKVVQQELPLQDGSIFVIPPGYDVEITDKHVRVERATNEHRAKPSIDRLFRTAAESFGERLIAVILSGMGSDGVVGAREVKKQGGR